MNPDTYTAPVFNRFFDKAERHIKYIVSASDYARSLQKKKELLNAKKNDISGRIDEGTRRLRTPTEEVIVWQSQVVDMLSRMDTALNIAQETRSCVCSICAKHKLGRRCDAIIKEVDELLERAPSLFYSAEMVDCDTSNIVKSMPYVVEESQASYFAETCKCIEDSNSKANIIGIWGLGGVGKTTLLKMINNHFVGNSSMFEAIIWTVTSSEQSDVSRVQREIVKKLRLKEVDDIESQADLINSFLENKNFLLLVDDLWKGVDLYKVGVPNLNAGSRCRTKRVRKVIFTTRSKDVCGEMDAKKVIEVKCLNPTQSLILFTEKVGEEVIQSHSGIPKLAEDIVKECQGLPLALIIIGRAMSMKPNIDDWKITLDLLKNSQGHQVMGVDEKLLSVLKISYDYLASEQLRKCFLTISLWPEDYMISKNELIEFWMGFDLIYNFESKHEAYQFGHSLVSKLQAACLLEEAESDKYRYRGGYVKLHDVLRDLALWLGSDSGKNKNKWMVKAGVQLKNVPNVKAKWSEAEYISLMHNKIKELPSSIPSCPTLLVLALQGNRLTDKSSFGQFHSLTYLNLSMNSLRDFPKSVCDLRQLRYLNLSSNNMSNLPMELRNLKLLRYLILRHNRITNIPRGVFAELAELLVLDMFKAVDYTEGIMFDIEELKSIEKNLLSFGTSVGSEQELSKLMLLSELPVDDLAIEEWHGTTFHFTAAIRNPHLLEKLRISWSGDLVEIVFDKNETCQDIASLNLKTIWLYSLYSLKNIIWKAIAPEILLAELRKITIWTCGLLKDITWVIHLPSLEYLWLQCCDSMRIAVNSDMVDRQVLTFPSLKVFHLIDMGNLEKISYRSLAFPQLKHIRVEDCPNLKALPFEVETAPKLTKISGQKKWWEEVEWEDDNSRSHFSPFFNRLDY